MRRIGTKGNFLLHGAVVGDVGPPPDFAVQNHWRNKKASFNKNPGPGKKYMPFPLYPNRNFISFCSLKMKLQIRQPPFTIFCVLQF